VTGCGLERERERERERESGCERERGATGCGTVGAIKPVNFSSGLYYAGALAHHEHWKHRVCDWNFGTLREVTRTRMVRGQTTALVRWWRRRSVLSADGMRA
jgi:hypothetical protein